LLKEGSEKLRVELLSSGGLLRKVAVLDLRRRL
jgi:hypothetical protein